ncbi:Vms1/Ankzf1 family peptidyl-tRNA hydrolase [Catenulispora yoronensis]|uniref:Vms1/Ankzf1 family peptidyl-tRNA hydrolase n=1 Tax=Catenulispora yoronensis TaxID=450799 RepID=A0ABP5GZT6_9ACTN
MDLTLLRPLYDGGSSAPVVSVHLDTSRDDHDADKRLELTWQALRRELAGQGVDEPTLAALDGEVGASPHIVGPQGESLFAADGRVLGAFALSEPPPRSRAVVGPVPDPLETVLDLDHQVPYAVVALDRVGGDIEAYPAGAYDPATRRTYDGTTLHLTRVRAGGPSMASYHRRSLNAWTDNATGVAEETVQAASDVNASVVFVAGDPKAVPLLREELAALNLDADVVEVAGGRARDDAFAVLREAVDEALAERSRTEHEQMMAAYRDALGQGRAVHGIAAVTEALTQGNVERLLLAADRAPDPARWASAEDQRMVGSAPEALGPHAESAFEAAAGPLLLRAAVAGGAAFSELLPEVPADDGVAAILRFGG